MTIKINPDVIRKDGLEVDEYLTLLMMQHHFDFREALKRLEQKGLVVDGGFAADFSGEHYLLTKEGNSKLTDIVLDSDKKSSGYTQEELEELAQKLKDIYPKGKKDNKWYYAEGVQLIVRRLRIFFKKYGEYPADKIIEATQRYVKENEGDPNLRLLKYFIFKEARIGNGEITPSSDLLTYMENKGQENSNNDDWAIELV